MDNDNKVVSEVQRHKDVMLFLEEELEPLKLKNSSASYNLEQEYAKTKKNKSFFVPLILAGTILLVALVSIILTVSIDKRNKKIKVNVAEFNDVNLKSLIDTVARTQDQYEAAVKNKLQIERQMNSSLNAAADKRDGDLFTIKSLNLRDSKVQTKRESNVEKEYEETVASIHGLYDPLIEEAQSEIDVYEKKLNEYNDSKIQAAQEKQKALDSERQLQELERKKMADQYESRIESLENTIAINRKTYQEDLKTSLKQVSDKLQAEIDALDPVIKDVRAEEVMQRPSVNNKRLYDVENHEAFIPGNISDTKLADEMNDVKNLYSDFKYIDQKILDLPHKYTIGKYKKVDDVLVDQITNNMADSVYGLYKDKVSLKQEIQTLNENIEQMKKDHAAEVEALNQTHEEEVAALNKAREEELASEKAKAEDAFYTFMQGAGFSAIIDSAVSKEEIYVLVRPNARYLISDENGRAAEIPFKKPIRGTIYKMADGRYRFEPERDKNGEYISFDHASLVMGVQVKLK